MYRYTEATKAGAPYIIMYGTKDKAGNAAPPTYRTVAVVDPCSKTVTAAVATPAAPAAGNGTTNGGALHVISS